MPNILLYQGLLAGGDQVWGHLNFRKVLGIGAAISGVAILIISLPSWIWMLATGGFMIWFGWILVVNNR